MNFGRLYESLFLIVMIKHILFLFSSIKHLIVNVICLSQQILSNVNCTGFRWEFYGRVFDYPLNATLTSPNFSGSNDRYSANHVYCRRPGPGHVLN